MQSRQPIHGIEQLILHGRENENGRNRNRRNDTVSDLQLDDEVFARNISKVREGLDFTTVTKVPQTPDFMRGVINLRGNERRFWTCA